MNFVFGLTRWPNCANILVCTGAVTKFTGYESVVAVDSRVAQIGAKVRCQENETEVIAGASKI